MPCDQSPERTSTAIHWRQRTGDLLRRPRADAQGGRKRADISTRGRAPTDALPPRWSVRGCRPPPDSAGRRERGPTPSGFSGFLGRAPIEHHARCPSRRRSLAYDEFDRARRRRAASPRDGSRKRTGTCRGPCPHAGRLDSARCVGLGRRSGESLTTKVTHVSREPELDPPHDDLWDTDEVSAFLAVTRAGVHWLRKRHAQSFPAPAIDRPDCHLWRRHDIERWADVTGYRKRDIGWNTTAVASHLQVSRQRVHAMRHDPRLEFPAPLGHERNPLRWDRADIESWARLHGYPKPGQ